MYTGFYQVNTDFIKFLQGGPEQQDLARKETDFFTVLEGKVVAKVMALLIEHGFQAFATIDAVIRKNSFFEDNFIGSNPQINLPESDNWIEFFWQNRLLYQYKLAEHNHFADAELKTSFKKLEQAFISIVSGTEEPPTIMHGDLWGGNYMVDSSGAAVLIDPAVYYGHREADLAMTKLFGGFDSNFYHAYND